MEESRWIRVDAVFSEALSLPDNERSRFLDLACAGDPSLRAEVEELLDAADVADGYFEEQVSSRIARESGLLVNPSHAVGSRIGPYRVVGLLGEGGMGAVYLAERDDGQFEHRVAIKQAHSGWVQGGHVVERFLRERQILARLEHPNIARLLDGGVTEDGVPYLVMEYVEGMPIGEFCRTRGLSIRDRVRLLQDVGRAVQYAHRNLVIHRDLKPSNILVTAEGTPKLLDFGIAKFLSEEARSDLRPAGDPSSREGVENAVREDAVVTSTYATPAYAAPEQIRGDGVTTMTDVYALGVLLHELLVGIRPRKGNWEALRRSVPRDLYEICRKACREDPDRRYDSAQALVEDLGRQIESRPVRAHPPTFRYRALKFMERNRGGVLAAAVVLLSLLGGLGGAVWQGQVARAEATKAREVSQFVLGLFEGSDPERGSAEETTLTELLNRGAERIEDELAGQPSLQAEMYALIGPIHSRLGMHQEGRRMLNRAIEFQSAGSGFGGASHARSVLEMAHLEVRLGNIEEADRLYRDARRWFTALHGSGSIEVARVERSLAALANTEGRYIEADSLYRTARSKLVAGGVAESELLLLDLDHLGVLHAMEEPERVTRMYERIMANRGHLEDASSTALARGMFGLGVEAVYGGDPEGAEPLIRGALELRRQVYGERHAEVAGAMAELATVYWSLGRFEEALQTRAEAVDMLRETQGPDHPNYAMWLGGYAVFLGKSGQAERAVDLFVETERIQVAALGEGHLHVAMTRKNLGRTLMLLDRYAEAIPVLEAGLSSWSEAMGDRGNYAEESRLDIAFSRSELGGSLLEQGDFAAAEPYLLAAHRTYESLDPPGEGREAVVKNRERLSRLYEEWGRPDEAARFAGMIPR